MRVLNAIAAIAGVLALAGLSGWSQAQPFPNRPLRLIAPFPPGGTVDISARLIQEEWGKRLGQPVVIENRGGASGNIGMDAVAKAAPDGYTLGINTMSLAINPALFSKMPFDTVKDLVGVGGVATSQHVLVVHPGVPAANVKELVALAKSSQSKLSYGSAGSGSTFHLAAELFLDASGVNVLHVPYRGGGPAMLDTIAGQVQLSFPVLSAALPQVKGGKLRALGVTGARRSPLPTIGEAGVPGYVFETRRVSRPFPFRRQKPTSCCAARSSAGASS